jgi:hypothetical protein
MLLDKPPKVWRVYAIKKAGPRTKELTIGAGNRGV